MKVVLIRVKFGKKKK